MPSIADLRKQFPTLGGMSDYEIADVYAQGEGVQRETAWYELGVTPPDAPGVKSSADAFAGATVKGLGQWGRETFTNSQTPNAMENYGRDVMAANPSSGATVFDDTGMAMREIGGQVGAAAGMQVGLQAVGAGLRMIPTLPTQALGWGISALGPAIAFAAPAYESIRARQDENGEKDLLAANLGAGTTGWIEQRFGLNKLLKPGAMGSATRTRIAEEFGKTPLRTGLGTWLKTGAAEGMEELAQNPVEQFAGGDDPLSAKSLAETGIGGAHGVVGGLMFGSVPAGIRGLQHKNLAGQLRSEGYLGDSATPVDLLGGLEKRDTAAYAAQTQDQAAAINSRLDGMRAARDARVFPDGHQGVLDLQAPIEGNDVVESGAVNPYNVAGTVSDLEHGAPVSLDEPQGDMFGRAQAVDTYVPGAAKAAAREAKVAPKAVGKTAKQFVSEMAAASETAAITPEQATSLNDLWTKSDLSGKAARDLRTQLKDMVVSNQAAATVAPETPEAALARKAVAPNEDSARTLGMTLLSSIPMGRKSPVTGKPVDFGGMLRTYFGFDGAHDEKLAAVAVAHGYPNNESARQVAWGNLRKAKEQLKAAAARIGLTEEQAAGAIQAMIKARVGDLGATDNQLEIAKLAGATDTALESENQGMMSYEDAAQQGMLSGSMHADPSTKAALDAADQGAPVTAARDYVAENKTPVDKLLTGDRAPDAENLFDLTNVTDEEKGKTAEQVAADRAAKALAEKDAEDSNLEEVTRGTTSAPSYAHEAEEYAAAQDDYEYTTEMLARQGVVLPPWDTLDLRGKDEITQLFKSELNNPTGKINQTNLEQMYAYYTDEAVKRASRESAVQHEPAAAAEPEVQESSRRVAAEAKPKVKRAKKAAGAKADAPAAAAEREVDVGGTKFPADLVALWTDFWNNTVAAEAGVTTWPGLSDSQKYHLLSVDLKDQSAYETAVHSVLGEINNADDVFFSEAERPSGVSEEDLNEVLALLNADPETTLGIKELTDEELDTAETLFLSDFKEGTRKHYGRKHRLAVRLRQDSDTAANDLGGKATTERVSDSPLGPFSGYRTVANVDEDGTLNVEVWGKEQIDAGLTEEPALLFSVSPDGTLVVNGPPPFSKTFKELEKRGWAERATAGGKEAPGWTRLVGEKDGKLPLSQVAPLIGEVHARARLNKSVSHMGLHWARATGMLGLSDKNGGAAFFSEGNSAGTTKQKIESVLKKLFFSPSRFDAIVTIYATQADAYTATGSAAFSEGKSKKRGFKTPDGKVGLIAENIPAGQELGVALHEIGVHLGMEKLVGAANMKWLADRIDAWRQKDDGSVESQVAKWAYDKALSSSSGAEHTQEELIAYMVEGLVNAGIDPQAAGMTEAHRWFRKLWAAAKVALRTIGFKNADAFTPQMMVDLAYGAAHLELEGAWHGTAADFRKFNHAYMGAGEGAQAFGWGTYLAQRVGIAKDYWKSDVGRKSRFNFDRGYFQVGAERVGADDYAAFANAVREGGFEAADISATWGYLQAALEKHKDKTFSRIEAEAYRLARQDRASHYSSLDVVSEILDSISGFSTKQDSPEGSLMRVASNVRDDEFLDWDKPLSEQSEVVKSALRKGRFGYMPSKKGAYQYKAISEELGSDKAASEYLDSIGIKGIKFLDQPSRRTETEVLDATGAVADLKGERTVQAFVNGFATLQDAYAEAIGQAHKYQAMDRVARVLEQWIDAGYSLREADQTRNLVIFNDKNLVRAATQVGAKSDRVKFSEASTAMNSIGAGIGNLLTNPKRALKEHGLGWLSLTHIGEVAKNLAPSVQEYLGVSRAMQVTAKQWVAKAAATDLKWSKLDKANSDLLGDVMLRSTMTKYDPTSTVTPGTPDQVQVKRNFEKLSPEAQALYAEVRNHYTAVLNERKGIVLGVIGQMYDAKIEVARAAGDTKAVAKWEKQKVKRTADTRHQYAQMHGPYFPLMRLGRWYAVGMSKELSALMDKQEEGMATSEDVKRIAALRANKAHYTTKSYDGERQAKEGMAAMSKTFPVTRYNVAEVKSQATKTLSAAGLSDVDAYIDEGFDSGTAGKIKSLMAEIYFDNLPEHNVLKRQMKRETIEGADTDMRRVFARSSLNDAHYISRLKHQDDLRSALFAVSKDGKKNGPDARMIYNELQRRADLSMDISDNPVVNKLLNVSYLAHLGANPAFILTNMTQVPMITLPWLAARYTAGQATGAIRKAYADAHTIIKSSYQKQGWRAELDWKGKVTDGESKMLESLLNRNLLDITIEHDLGATADMRSQKVGDALRMINLPVHISELANRTVTALAAYRLAIQDGSAQEHAENIAAKAVSETQLDYSGLNAPRHLQSMFGSKTIARLAGQFRKYQQGMLWLIGKNMYDAVKGNDKDKRIAFRTLVGLFTTTGSMAGVLGMPAIGSLLWLATLFGSAFDDDDDPFDAERELRNWLTDLLGEDVAQVVTKGLPTVAGLDMSKRVGLGDVAAPLPFLRDGKTGPDKVGNTMAAIMGAPAGTVADWVDGIQMMQDGQWQKGAEKLVPLKLIRNISAAERFATEGMTKRNGDLIKEMDAWDATLRATGFSSSSESSYYEANAAVEDTKRAATEVRNRLLRDYAQAKLKGESTSDIEADIQDYNTRHAAKGARIDANSKLKAVQQRRLQQKERGTSGVSTRKANQPYLENARFAGG